MKKILNIICLLFITTFTSQSLLANENSGLEITENDFTIGDENAPITIIEYASMSCSHCADFHTNTLPELKTEFMDWKPNNLWDYKKDGNIYYIDHHQSHAAYAYLTSGFTESDILAIDGRGYKYNTVFFDKNGTPHDLNLSIGELWDYFSKELGFGTLGASKVMGLVGYGKSRKILMKLYMLLDEFWSMEDRKDKKI